MNRLKDQNIVKEVRSMKSPAMKTKTMMKMMMMKRTKMTVMQILSQSYLKDPQMIMSLGLQQQLLRAIQRNEAGLCRIYQVLKEKNLIIAEDKCLCIRPIMKRKWKNIIMALGELPFHQ